jgi:ADP-heptose:LPS heptosyltransferase
MTGPYLAKNRVLLLALRSCDAVLGVLRPARQGPLPASPRRILLALGGHLGDAVVATAAIEHLRRALPESEIGIVLPSWSRAVLERDDRLHWLHTIDHWKSNRASASWISRWRRYRASRRNALAEIRSVGYDVAVDLYAYFPNMALALWRSGIPVRLGFASGGLGPLYTHVVPWQDDLQHVAERQVALVARLAPARPVATVLRYSLPEDAPVGEAGQHAAQQRASNGLTEAAYTVVHMGSGAGERQWPARCWKELATRLAEEGHILVFTGRGRQEATAIASITDALPGALNLCDRLEWNDLVEVIRRARLVLTVETAAAHVAAATETPCVALWSGITSAHHWGPLGSSVSLVAHHPPCAPCFRSHGCAQMTCIQDVTVTDVLSAVQRTLMSSPSVSLAARRNAEVAP